MQAREMERSFPKHHKDCIKQVMAMWGEGISVMYPSGKIKRVKKRR